MSKLNVLTGVGPHKGLSRRSSMTRTKAAKLPLTPAGRQEERYVLSRATSLESWRPIEGHETAEITRVCMEQAASCRLREIEEAYGLPISVNYDYGNYARPPGSARNLLELNTDDGKEREVVATMEIRNGSHSRREKGFDTPSGCGPTSSRFTISARPSRQHDQAIKLWTTDQKQTHGATGTSRAGYCARRASWKTPLRYTRT